jgi:hypothetical protein
MENTVITESLESAKDKILSLDSIFFANVFDFESIKKSVIKDGLTLISVDEEKLFKTKWISSTSLYFSDETIIGKGVNSSETHIKTMSNISTRLVKLYSQFGTFDPMNEYN